MAFPFLYLALSLASGILFSFLAPVPSSVLIPSLAASFSLTWLFFFLRKHPICFVFLLLSFFLLGALLYLHQNKNYQQNPLRRLQASEYMDFYGHLYKSISPRKDRDYLYLKVDRVSYKKETRNIEGNLRVSVLRSDDSSSRLDLHVKDRVKISAKISQFQGFRNFFGTPLNHYLKIKNIHQRAFTKSPQLVEKIKSGPTYSPLRIFSVLRGTLQKKIENHFSTLTSTSSPSPSLSSQGAVLEALLLGERGRMNQEITRSLQSAGIFHLFAISGAHIAIISFFLFSLFRLFQLPQRVSYILLIVILIFFAFLVEGRPSVLRATIMAVAFLLAKLLWKNAHLINTIAISAFFLLLFNPFSLFDLGFQLTFAATFSIILFFPKIIKFLPRLPWRISEIFVLSLTAQLGVLPFIVHSFNRVTFSALLLNYAALPLVGVIMGAGYIFLALSFIHTFLAQLLSQGLHFLIEALLFISHILDPLSFLSYRIPTPHLWTLLGYFLFLLLFLVPSRWKGQKPATWVFFLGFLGVLILYPFTPTSQNLKTTFIDVGEGDSILVEFPGREKMLIDGGGSRLGSFDLGEFVVSSFLWNKGIKKIDYLVLTHAHPDHLNGLKAIARNFRIEEYWEAYSPSENPSYAEFRRLLPLSVQKKRIFRGDSLDKGKINIDVLHPPEDDPLVPKTHNNQSLVLRISYGETSFLLTGDIEDSVEKQIVRHFKDIQSQMLKSPHHGSNSSSCMDFLKAVNPKAVVISVGKGNPYGFPDAQPLKNYKKTGARVYRTDIHGAVEITSDGTHLSVRTATSPKKDSY
ncbi:DNA internalization-related competence protein ComEC/Rec2 [bacterium]|nr:DNA internalization-related competence protein ComEC/Rec2 [bacterium]